MTTVSKKYGQRILGRTRRTALAMAIAAIIVAVLVGCGADEPATAQAPPQIGGEPKATAVIAEAAEETNEPEPPRALEVLAPPTSTPAQESRTTDEETNGIEPTSLVQYKKGRTLHFGVVSVERTPELRYSTCEALVGSTPPVCDPSGIDRNWTIAPSAEGLELVLVRARVENHTVVSTILHVDRTSAELRDVADVVYRPISVADSAWRDFRGQPVALVRMDMGECFDGQRTLLHAGSVVIWQSESESIHYIDFENAAVVGGPQGRAEIAPRASLSRIIDEAGTYPYVCGSPDDSESPAEIRAVSPDVIYDYIKRTTTFLLGSFELAQGHGLDGFLIFEAPIGTEFQDVRWKAGDSITIGF